jgi:long-chain acyl-CoA synthetase
VAKWFRSLQLEILEDYGQTESTGVICMTIPGKECAGTVGTPVPGLEFKLAEDGEILTRGKHVFVGYFKDEAATRATLEEGWLHTGDLGEWTESKMIRIRGRKKEIMKTSGGKMVAPLPIEERIKTAEIVSQVCMVGDNRKYFSAIVTLVEPVILELQKQKNAITSEGIVTDSSVLKKVEAEVKRVNAELASFEQIKRFTVLGREFSIAEGEMTPTLKMKRSVIESRFKEVIDSMYSGAGAD